MKKLIVPVLGLMVLASPSWAWSQVTGNITNIDSSKRQIVLDNGQTYSLQSKVKMSSLAVGDKVSLNSEKKAGQNIVNKVTKTG